MPSAIADLLICRLSSLRSTIWRKRAPHSLPGPPPGRARRRAGVADVMIFAAHDERGGPCGSGRPRYSRASLSVPRCCRTSEGRRRSLHSDRPSAAVMKAADRVDCSPRHTRRASPVAKLGRRVGQHMTGAEDATAGRDCELASPLFGARHSLIGGVVLHQSHQRWLSTTEPVECGRPATAGVPRRRRLVRLSPAEYAMLPARRIPAPTDARRAHAVRSRPAPAAARDRRRNTTHRLQPGRGAYGGGHAGVARC